MSDRDLFGAPSAPAPRPKDSDKPVTILLQCHAETTLSWMVSRPGSMRKVFLPASLCSRGTDDRFTMPLWVARARGLM